MHVILLQMASTSLIYYSNGDEPLTPKSDISGCETDEIHHKDDTTSEIAHRQRHEYTDIESSSSPVPISGKRHTPAFKGRFHGQSSDYYGFHGFRGYTAIDVRIIILA